MKTLSYAQNDRVTSIIIVISLRRHSPVGIRIIAPADRVPQDAVENIFIRLIHLIQIHFHRFLRPMALTGFLNRRHLRVQPIERNDVRHDSVGGQIRLSMKQLFIGVADASI